MVDYVIYAGSDDHAVWSTGTTGWANARSGSSGLNDTNNTATHATGVQFSSPNYFCRQTFLPFDTSGIVAGTVSNAHLYMNVASLNGATSMDVYEVTFSTGTGAWIAGASLGSPLVTSAVNATGSKDFALPLTSIPAVSAYGLMLAGAKQRTNVAPTTSEVVNFSSSRATGTTNDPRLEFTVTPSVSPIIGNSSVNFTNSGTVVSRGPIVGAADISFGNTGSVSAKAALTGATDLTFPTSGVLTGRYQIAGSTALTFSLTGTMGSGAMTGVAELTFDSVGTLTAIAQITGDAGFTFGSVTTLSAKGYMNAFTMVTFDLSGTMTYNQLLSGNTSLAFGGSGTIVGRARYAITPDVVSQYYTITPDVTL